MGLPAGATRLTSQASAGLGPTAGSARGPS